jgi:hypothetical protein
MNTINIWLIFSLGFLSGYLLGRYHGFSRMIEEIEKHGGQTAVNATKGSK